jgi:phosphoglycolate phosphatase
VVLPPLLICDLDGTLIDSFADIRGGIRTALRHIGVEPTDELLSFVRRGIGLELFFVRATGATPRAPNQLDRFKSFVDTYRRSYFEDHNDSKPFDGVIRTLETLRAGHPETVIAVATAKRTDMAQRVINEHGLAELVDIVRGSDGLEHKPNPATLLDVAKTAGIDVTRAAMIGDTDRDVLAAKNARCTSIAATYGGWTRDEMAELDPDHLVDAFEDLLDLFE